MDDVIKDTGPKKRSEPGPERGSRWRGTMGVNHVGINTVSLLVLRRRVFSSFTVRFRGLLQKFIPLGYQLQEHIRYTKYEYAEAITINAIAYI